MKRFKWEPPALMVRVMALGVWLVWSSKNTLVGITPEPGARTVEFRVGNERGIVEVLAPAADAGANAAAPSAVPATSPAAAPSAETRLRVRLRNGFASDWMDRAEFTRLYGERAYLSVAQRGDNVVFRLFNITGWASLAWVCIGLIGQGAFFGRMLVQWVLSEKTRASVVPPIFWWFSLIGGAFLFTYFVWRQDFVGVLGQSTGLVIYARNLRLISKQRRRAERDAPGPADPAPRDGAANAAG